MPKVILMILIAILLVTGCIGDKSKESEDSPVKPATTTSITPEIPPLQKADVIAYRQKAEQVEHDLFISGDAYMCNGKKEPEIALPSSENNQFEHYFYCERFGTRDKVKKHLTSVMTQAAAESEIESRIHSRLLSEHNDRMAVARWGGVPITLDWKHAGVTDIKIDGSNAEATIKVMNYSYKEYLTYRVKYRYENGWKEHSFDYDERLQAISTMNNNNVDNANQISTYDKQKQVNDQLCDVTTLSIIDIDKVIARYTKKYAQQQMELSEFGLDEMYLSMGECFDVEMWLTIYNIGKHGAEPSDLSETLYVFTDAVVEMEKLYSGSESRYIHSSVRSMAVFQFHLYLMEKMKLSGDSRPDISGYNKQMREINQSLDKLRNKKLTVEEGVHTKENLADAQKKWDAEMNRLTESMDKLKELLKDKDTASVYLLGTVSNRMKEIWDKL